MGDILSTIGGGIGGIAGIAGAFDQDVMDRPRDPTYAGELRSTFDAIRGIYPDIMNLQGQLQGQATDNELAMIRQFSQGLRTADPLYGGVYNKATRDLALGNRLSDAQRRNVASNVRASQSAQGFGYSPSDTFAEALAMGGAGDALEQQRYQNAMGALGAEQSYMRHMGTQTPNVAAMTMNNPWAQDIGMSVWNSKMDEYMGSVNAQRAVDYQTMMNLSGGGGGGGGGGGDSSWISSLINGSSSNDSSSGSDDYNWFLSR